MIAFFAHFCMDWNCFVPLIVERTPLLEQGQSPYPILINYTELDVSVRSMYVYDTYINKGAPYSEKKVK